PLKREKDLAHGVQREIKNPKTDRGHQRHDTKKQQNGEHDAGPYHQMQEGVARVEPSQCWKQRVTGIEVLRVDRLQIITDRQNALGTDEAIDLREKRSERHQVGYRQTTQENRSRHSTTVAALVSTVKNNRTHI